MAPLVFFSQDNSQMNSSSNKTKTPEDASQVFGKSDETPQNIPDTKDNDLELVSGSIEKELADDSFTFSEDKSSEHRTLRQQQEIALGEQGVTDEIKISEEAPSDLQKSSSEKGSSIESKGPSSISLDTITTQNFSSNESQDAVNSEREDVSTQTSWSSERTSKKAKNSLSTLPRAEANFSDEPQNATGESEPNGKPEIEKNLRQSDVEKAAVEGSRPLAMATETTALRQSDPADQSGGFSTDDVESARDRVLPDSTEGHFYGQTSEQNENENLSPARFTSSKGSEGSSEYSSLKMSGTSASTRESELLPTEDVVASKGTTEEGAKSIGGKDTKSDIISSAATAESNELSQGNAVVVSHQLEKSSGKEFCPQKKSVTLMKRMKEEPGIKQTEKQSTLLEVQLKARVVAWKERNY